VQVWGVDSQWQADLVEMQKYKRVNQGYRYLLTVIDIFSKYAWVKPLHDKTGHSITEAFSQIINESDRFPNKLQTDDGKEFKNREFQDFLKDKGIVFFTVPSDKKASVVERFNRTLKDIMWRYFTHSNSTQ